MNAVSVTDVTNTLRAGNRVFYGAMTCAISVLFHLNDAGCAATDIDVRGGKPIFQVDRPPAFIAGVATVRRCDGTRIERRMVAPFFGGQIEWVEREVWR